VSLSESDNVQPVGVVIVGNEDRFPDMRSTKTQTRLLGAICTCVLLSILVAGLWPFQAPRNEVDWLSQGNGVLFGKYGSIVSADTFRAAPPQADNSCSLEIWLEASRVNSSGTILAFYSPTSQAILFALRQSLGDLVIQRGSHRQLGKAARVYVNDIFSQLIPVFVTISSGETGTAIYVDGKLVKKSPNFRFSSQNLAGQFIVGNAPLSTHNWSGQVYALAVYDRALPVAEVAQHFADWSKSKQPDLASKEGIVARYVFNEGKGNIIHNQVDSATDLLIPERFFVLHEQLLAWPWDEFRSDWGYLKDVGINIAGFIPLGFFFSAYFSSIRNIKRAIWLTIALGFAVSLTIEVLQAFLPTRDSGMTDLITNTLGTSLGALLYVSSVKHNWFNRAGVSSVLPVEEEQRVFSSLSS
jgi:hypothetical protein